MRLHKRRPSSEKARPNLAGDVVRKTIKRAPRSMFRYLVVFICLLLSLYAPFLVMLTHGSPLRVSNHAGIDANISGTPNEIEVKTRVEAEEKEAARLQQADEEAEALAEEEVKANAPESSSIPADISRPLFNGCVSTFNMEEIPESDRELLLFAAPKSFDAIPKNIEAWLHSLEGRGHLILFSNDLNTLEACGRRGISVMCVEHTYDGFPRFDAMMRKMEQVQPNGIVAFANTDLEFSDSSMSSLSDSLKWLSTQTLDVMIPGEFSTPYSNLGTGTKFWFAALNRWDKDENGLSTLHSTGGYDVWAWNVNLGGPSLLPFDIPPFRYPLASYDNWLFDMVNKANDRNVIDITAASTVLHVEHSRKDYNVVAYDGASGHYINRYLALNNPLPVGSSNTTMVHCTGCGTTVAAPYVFNNFELHQAEVLEHIKYNHKYPNITEQVWKVTAKKYGMLPPLLPSLPKSGYSMEEILSRQANEEGFVLLTAVTYNYREYLLNLKCNLERVGKSYDHLVIAALDASVYEWGALQGLPIFLSNEILVDQNQTVSTGHDYGSQEFKKTTKLKSRTTLTILEAGYSVVYSDVDITWFQDPFSALHPYMNLSSGLTIQSNAPYNAYHPKKKVRPHESVGLVKSKKASNAFHCLNSGLYVAPNSSLMRRAFQDIVKEAKKGSFSEQPYFYHVLCVRPPSATVRDDACKYHPYNPEKKKNDPLTTYLPVQTLDRLEHPNGAVMLGPHSSTIYKLGAEAFEQLSGQQVFSTHNNWIVGRDEKKGRQVDSGWWYIKNGLCAYKGDKI
mmetsp:Transcript_17686/g.21109  ORF Transcript_17686/g.21109 Transcript_17686/m.21109 type:complete len:791 (-) Transcript_17686:271-2643(-)